MTIFMNENTYPHPRPRPLPCERDDKDVGPFHPAVRRENSVYLRQHLAMRLRPVTGSLQLGWRCVVATVNVAAPRAT